MLQALPGEAPWETDSMENIGKQCHQREVIRVAYLIPEFPSSYFSLSPQHHRLLKRSPHPVAGGSDL
jgi:hypothetical protein